MRPSNHPGTVLVVITEDWFAASHFKPLLLELSTLFDDVVVATTPSGHTADLEGLGVRCVAVEMNRGSTNPRAQLAVRSELKTLIDDLCPQVVHAISLQPMVVASMATHRVRHRPDALILHITGLGHLGVSRKLKDRAIRRMAFAAIRQFTRGQHIWLLAENHDDINALVASGVGSSKNSSISPGAGVHPDAFPAQAPCSSSPPVIGFVGRLVRSKGVDVLVSASGQLADRGVDQTLTICGDPDEGNPQSVTMQELDEWTAGGRIVHLGHVSDVSGFWATASIAAVPTLGGEGIPRSLLEAAASARPIVASDVPGCRDFIEDGVCGILVPPGDSAALAHALERLVTDSELRRRMGEAARARFVGGYTEEHVRSAIRWTYGRALQSSSGVT